MEVAWFDTHPENDDPRYTGCFGNYPFFESGIVLGADVSRGLFVWSLGPHFVRGDSDGSGRLGISDAIRILQHLFDGNADVRIDPYDAADADDDGRVNLTDALRILRFLFQSGPAPAAPFPGPGIDPTQDSLPATSPERRP